MKSTAKQISVALTQKGIKQAIATKFIEITVIDRNGVVHNALLGEEYRVHAPMFFAFIEQRAQLVNPCTYISMENTIGLMDVIRKTDKADASHLIETLGRANPYDELTVMTRYVDIQQELREVVAECLNSYFNDAVDTVCLHVNLKALQNASSLC